MVLVCIASVVGCGESLSPPVRGEVGMRDLELVLPAIRGEPAVATATPIETPQAWLDGLATPDGFANVGSTTTSEAYIKGTYVTAGWDKDVLWYEYGMSGLGTGYEMIPWFNVARDGATLVERTGTGIRLNLGMIPSSFTPSMRETYRPGPTCGLTVNVKVVFKVFTGISTDLLDLSLAAQREGGAFSSQPACPPPPTKTAGTPTEEPVPGGGTKITICYFEVWVDKYGQVVDYRLITCESYVVYQS
jgi:hypothetical protein